MAGLNYQLTYIVKTISYLLIKNNKAKRHPANIIKEEEVQMIKISQKQRINSNRDNN